jgi:hypothetical protein
MNIESSPPRLINQVYATAFVRGTDPQSLSDALLILKNPVPRILEKRINNHDLYSGKILGGSLANLEEFCGILGDQIKLLLERRVAGEIFGRKADGLGHRAFRSNTPLNCL